MNAFNAILTALADWLLSPFGRWPLAGLIFWSAVAGVLMTVAFRYTSNQRAVRAAADRSRAQALAIKLFGHDPRAIFGGLFGLLRYTVLRLAYSLPPVLVMLIPFTLFLTQLAARYEHRALVPGEPTIVKLELSERDWPRQQRNVALSTSPEIVVETPPLRDATERAVYWRLRPTAGATTLHWRVGDEEIEKRLCVAADGQPLATISTRRPGRGWFDRLLNPAEPALGSASSVVGIEVEHPPRETPVWGVAVPWWLTSLAASIVAALVAAPFVGVRF